MVTDRKIIVSNGKASLNLTCKPYYVTKTEGFDTLDITNVSSQGYGQDGATKMNSYVNPRDLRIIGQIEAHTTYQMEMLMEKISNIFIPKKEIIINHFYGGHNRLITADIEKTPRFEFTKVSTVMKYTVYMIANQPYWRDPTETLIQMADVVGSFHFPLVIPKDKGVVFGIKSPSLIANVYNKSSIRVGMRFEFIANGSVKNPQLFNVNTREFFKINCDMNAGEKISVQTGQDAKTVKRIYQGKEESYIGKIDIAGGGSTFLELEPGDNLFRYSADSGEGMLEVRIYFYNKYSRA